MVTYINIAGKEYPVKFGHNTLRQFEVETGEPITNATRLPYSSTITLAFLGVRNGARKDGQKFEMTLEQFCDLLDDDAGALERLMKVFEQSQIAGGDNGKEGGDTGGNV